MLLDTSYEHILKVAANNISKRKIIKSGLGCNSIINILSQLNVNYKPRKFISLELLENNALFIIAPINCSGVWTHAVVYDKQNNKILDPDSGGSINNIDYLDNYNICYCIEIGEKDESPN